MQTEELSDLPYSSNSGCRTENGELHNSHCEPGDAGSQPCNLEVKKDKLNAEIAGPVEVDVGNGDSQLLLAAEVDRDLMGSSPVLQVSVELNDIAAVAKGTNCSSSRIRTESGCLTVQDGSPIRSQKRDGSPVSNSISVLKKAKMTVGELQPSVHVMYNSLPRDSKRKLEELLQRWSEWHAQHCSSSRDSNEVLESGEGTYFPALQVGLDNPSAVSFWMDNQQSNQLNKEFIPLDGKSVPLYDRGYSMVLTSTDGNLEGGLEIVNASRCFNCESYNHSLKDCPKPRDNVAVNNARKQHKSSKRNQNSNSRNPTRYYENTPGGKYDGLRPGVLDAETRQLLGLGELDPPPWLNRMREIGYPPGYLDPEDEDQPSGITIFADEESKEEKSKEEKEDGEIFETGNPEPPKKMSVEFPGINGPIPENADERLWTNGPSSSDSHRNRSLRRFNHSSEQHISSRGQQYHHEQRWSRDEGPPGCEPFNATLPGYSPRYSFHESSYGSQSARGGNISTPGPSFGRSLSDRVRNHLGNEGSPNRDSFASVPYSPPVRLFSPLNYGSANSENRDYDSPRDFNPDVNSRHWYDRHHHQHHSWRD
ncbi:hypothetical protein U1Q18_005381 [Sarracenia purpurea var. burkii]